MLAKRARDDANMTGEDCLEEWRPAYPIAARFLVREPQAHHHVRNAFQ